MTTRLFFPIRSLARWPLSFSFSSFFFSSTPTFFFFPKMDSGGIGSLGFLTGANLPWINYGWDYGPCAWGRGYKPEAFDAAFADLTSRGANCVRLWVFGDGRASPSFDLSTPATRSLTTGIHPDFFADFGDMLGKAAKHNIKVMPVLWDFIAMNIPKPTDKPTPQQGGHGALFTDPNLANAFMENALRPLIQQFGAHPAIAAWDIFNEPEWCVAETGEATTTQKVPLAAMRTFIGRACSIVHNEGGPGTLVTVGSASVKWSWEKTETRPSWCSDFWGDDALVASNNGDPASFLDFGQTHYYPWMKKEIDPFVNQPETYCGGGGCSGGQGQKKQRQKPLIIGEAQANLLQTYSAAALLRNARERGYAGLLYWSYKVRVFLERETEREVAEGALVVGALLLFSLTKNEFKKKKQEVDDKGGWDDFAKCVGGECEGAFAAVSGGGPGKAEKFINRVFGGFK